MAWFSGWKAFCLSVHLTPDEHAATLWTMEVQFTPEQEAKLNQIAKSEGVPPDRLVRDAALGLIEADGSDSESTQGAPIRKLCPECGHRFRGNGWDGIDAHWRSRHEGVLPYEFAWPLIQSGRYDSPDREDAEDLFIAEKRLADLREGRSRTHSLEEVERDLGLVG